MPEITRHHIRQSLLLRRRRITRLDMQAAGIKIAHHCKQLPFVKDSQRIAIYLAHQGEVATQPLIDWLWQVGKACYLPVVSAKGKVLRFAAYTPNTLLKVNRFHILEPESEPEQLLEGRGLNLVFLPLVGFDAQGNRLGMGGGFYDATFAHIRQSGDPCPLKVGLAYSWQQVAHIPSEPWDVPLDAVITEQGYRAFSKRYGYHTL